MSMHRNKNYKIKREGRKIKHRKERENNVINMKVNIRFKKKILVQHNDRM